jgi:hypothetical protein
LFGTSCKTSLTPSLQTQAIASPKNIDTQLSAFNIRDNAAGRGPAAKELPNNGVLQ